MRCIEGSTTGSVWRSALQLIETSGIKVLTEDGQETKELTNIQLHIKHPDVGWPIANSGWDIPALEIYKNEIITSRNETGFDYTYGERLRTDIDQIQLVTEKLKAHRTTRRAVAITWQPNIDNKPDFHPPCLIALDFMIRGEKLHLTTFFRSWDVGQAAPSNIYGLYKLMEIIAREVDADIGSLTIFACSAHLYIV